MICYDEPDENYGGHFRVRITEAEAIRRARAAARARGFSYLTDTDALDDFMQVHWAWREEDDSK